VTASEREAVRQEFTRAAAGFADRTRGRFDSLGVLGFSRVPPGASVVEVGGGTGSFISLFEGGGRTLVNVDLTPAMLAVSRRSHPRVLLLNADAAKLPLATGSVDLVAGAQVLHHIHKPLPVLREMKRVAAPTGRVLIVDQCATERYEEAVAMNELEIVRDPSHAASRPPSAFRTLLRAAGLSILGERVVEVPERFSQWMRPGEFPDERIRSVLDFIERRGRETGMRFERDGDEWVFTRRRIMLLAE
jgi:SAM-dependent methyltransferase